MEVTASGVGIIIGAGIYVVVGTATAEAGAGVWIAFLLAPSVPSRDYFPAYASAIELRAARLSFYVNAMNERCKVRDHRNRAPILWRTSTPEALPDSATLRTLSAISVMSAELAAEH